MAKNKKGKKSKNKNYRDPGKFRKSQAEKSAQPEQNPFEIRVNKRKHETMGRMEKHERGVPGISRSKAIQKRKTSLLTEYKSRNKTNVLVDSRIWEKNKSMDEEEKTLRRVAFEKSLQYKRKSMFNLQDEEDTLLTHKGAALANIDRYDDPRDAADSDDEKLDREFVGDAHFSGFSQPREKFDQQDQEQPEDERNPKSRDEIIRNLILSSKEKRMEKEKETQEHFSAVLRLDDEFRSPEFRDLFKNLNADKNQTSLSDEKSDYDKLVKELHFEARGGRGTDATKTPEQLAEEEQFKLKELEASRFRRMQMEDLDRKHRSAEDLDDGFLIEDANEDEDNEQYEQEEEDNSDDEGRHQKSDDEDEKSDEDNFSDLEDSDEETVSQDKKTKQKVTFEKVKVADPKIPLAIFTADGKILLNDKVVERKEIPDLCKKTLNYILDLSSQRLSTQFFLICETLITQLYSLLLKEPSCSEMFRAKILEARKKFISKKGKVLTAEQIILLQLCPSLFPATDFKHPVMTPVVIFLSEIMNKHKLEDFSSVVKILYIVSVMYECVQETKRYSPEILNTLTSLLLCYCNPKSQFQNLLVPCAKEAKKMLHIESSLQNSSIDPIKPDLNMLKPAKDFHPNLQTKLGILLRVLEWLQKFVTLYQHLPSATEIFNRFKNILCELKSLEWPPVINDLIAANITQIESIGSSKEVLKIPVDRPKPLRMYEPLIDDKFDGRKRRKGTDSAKHVSKLQHKVKQEMKSAIREIKKDNVFLANQQLKEQMQKDQERKRKVQELLSSLANQEGDYQKIKRQK